MNSKLILGLLLYLLVVMNGKLFAQEGEGIEEQIIESLIEDLDENIDVSEFTERLRYYLKNPIDLNKTDGTELIDLLFLLPNQISNLLAYRVQSGNFISLLELQSVLGFDITTVRKLIPFVKLSLTPSFSLPTFESIKKNVDHDLMLRYGRMIQKQAGYQIEDTTRSRYLGSPDRYALRYRLNYKSNIKFSINAEKDAGEPFFGKMQSAGFDYYSASLEVKNLGRFKQIIVGDYALQFGQGLVLWNGLSFGKGSWAGSIVKQGTGLRSYKSMNEFGFQRGLATNFTLGKFEITPFIAYNSLTANLKEIDNDVFVTSISSSGYHRTPTELNNKNTVKQFVYGSNISYNVRQLKLGVTFLNTSYNEYVSKGDELRNKFSFEGTNLTNIGIHYQYSYKNTFFYGETAHSIGAGWATLNGLISSLHPKLSLLIQQRYYQKEYQSIFAQAVGENSKVSNETGIYAGLTYKLTRKVEWLNYVDYFKFPWVSFRLNSPGSGLDYFSQFTYTWYKKGRLILRYRYRLNQQNATVDGRNELVSADVSRNQGRLDFQYAWNSSWKTGSRFEAVNYHKEFENKEYGWLAFQDVQWTLMNNKYAASVRLAYFNTDSYNARIYAFESDVLYASSFPIYYLRGWRTYLNTKIKVTKGLDLWFRYALTAYKNLEKIGSGLDQIDGNKRSDFRVQLRYQW